MAFRKFGDAQPLQPVEEERHDADGQGINVTATRREGEQLVLDTDEIIHENESER